jgi:hypothetical protein
MQRSKSEKRHRAFAYRGNAHILFYAYGADAAKAFKSPNRFLRQFRESNRRRVA